MADSDTSEPRARKFHEGWMYHQPTNGKVWARYWMVLRGNMLFIFGSDRTGKDEMKGTLTLGPDTELRNLPPESKKKGFKFEMSTASSSNERKINRFKFDKENERDVWKAFVVGISVGIVPSDIHILPGQLKDVHEAIGEVRNRPPPLPDTNIQRPRINKSQSADLLSDQMDHRYNDRGYNDGNGSDDSGSFTSHVTRKTNRSESVPNAMMTGTTPAGGVQNLRQLMHRQRDLAIRDLVGASPTADRGEKQPFSSPYREPDPGPTVFSPRSPPPTAARVNTVSPPSSFSRATHDPAHRFSFDDRDHHRDDGLRSPIHNGHSGHFNNNQQHMFHLDAERNVEPPTWFFEIDDDSRQKAEQILTMGRRYGNVLMRTSTSFGASGKYVISMRREVAGGTKLDHYEVIKTAQGFKINVDNKHTGMRCLSDVMEFFVSVAGQGTVFMKTNDLDKVFGRTSDNSIPPAGCMEPEIYYNTSRLLTSKRYDTMRSVAPRWQVKQSPPQPSHNHVSSPSPPNLRHDSHSSPPNHRHESHSSPPNHHHESHSHESQSHHASNGFDSSSDYLQEQDSNWILSDGSKTHVPSQSESPPLSPGPQSWSTMQPSSPRRHSMDDWSSRSVTSARPASNKLNVSGDVSSNMLSAVRDINYGPVGSSNMGHTTLQETTSSRLMNSPPAPPPLPEPVADYPQREYANVPNAGGQEMRSYGRQHDDMHHLNHGMDQMNVQKDIPTPPPPPMLGGMSGPPSQAMIPGPPPLPPGGFPTGPPAQSFGTIPKPPPQTSSFSQARNSISDLQGELLGKLKGRREEIYATAQILTNY